MESCAKCQRPIIGDKKVTARRRDGSTITLCPDCVREIKAGKQQKQAQTALAAPDQTTPGPSKKSEDKWYKTIGSGILILAFTIFVAYQLNSLEAGTVESVRVWWPVAILYRMLGYWGAIACPGLIALLVLAIGAKQFIDQENQT